MTARLRERPVSLMSRLATWADYGLAVALTLCRGLRLPQRSAPKFQPSWFEPAYAFEAVHAARPFGCAAQLSQAAMPALAPRWHEVPRARAQQPWFVRPAEVVMLTLSFFLAAHLVGGGTPEARAPRAALTVVLGTTAPSPARVIAVRLSPTAEAVATAEVAGAAAAAPGAAAEGSAPAPAQGGDAIASEAPRAEAVSPPTARVESPPALQVNPAPVASQPPLSYAQVIAYAIEAGWPAELTDAVARVAWCESRFRPDVVGYGAYGLMQVVPLWFGYAGIDFALWADPVANLKAALAAFRYSEEQGHKTWAAWGCKPEAVAIP